MESAATAPAPATARRWRAIGSAIAIAALAATVAALYGHRDAIVAATAGVDGRWLAAGFALTVLASIIGFLAFAPLVRSIAGSALTRRRLAKLYFVGQLMRHLPGRYIGIAYQVLDTRAEVAVETWVATNLVHTLAIASTGVLVGLCVVLAPTPQIAAVAAGAVFLGLRLLVVDSSLPLAVARAASGARWRAVRSVGAALSALIRPKRGPVAACIDLAALSWLAYLAAWACYGQAFAGLGAWAGVQLSAHYALAWFIGFVTLVTPSGLGIRELSFVTLARDFAPGAVAYGLVLGRVSLLASDIVLGSLALAFARLPRMRNPPENASE